MNTNICKKCGKIIPKEYKYNKCERCRNLFIEKSKKIGGSIISGVVILISIFVREKSKK